MQLLNYVWFVYVTLNIVLPKVQKSGVQLQDLRMQGKGGRHGENPSLEECQIGLRYSFIVAV